MKTIWVFSIFKGSYPTLIVTAILFLCTPHIFLVPLIHSIYTYSLFLDNIYVPIIFTSELLKHLGRLWHDIWLCRKSVSVYLFMQPFLLLHRCNYMQQFLNRFILLCFMCMTITWTCLPFMCLPSPSEDRRGSWFPWNWSYRWVLGGKPGSSGRATNILTSETWSVLMLVTFCHYLWVLMSWNMNSHHFF